MYTKYTFLTRNAHIQKLMYGLIVHIMICSYL